MHAVAKTKDGQIYNVTGILADAALLDLAVLKAQPKDRVPFIPLSKAGTSIEQGTKLALIGNPLTRKDLVVAQGTVSARRSDPGGESFDVSMALPTEAIGSPAVNEKGEAIGVVTHGPGATGGNIVRASSAVNSLLAQIGPATKSRWQLAGSAPAASPSPPGEGPSPAKPKLPLAGAVPAKTRLIYSPAPGYPTAARHSYYPLKGTGRYRVTFASNGEVRDVAVVQSTRSETLDQAALETLRRWKAQPGPEWTANVPITFQP
jgi:TonB family protein